MMHGHPLLPRLGPALALALLVGAAFALSPAAARAEKKAASLPFAGPGAPALQKALEGAIDADARVAVAPAGTLESAAREVGADPGRLDRDPTVLSQVASAAQVDAVLKGLIVGPRLELTVVDGGTGNELRRLSVPLTRGKLDGAELQKTVQRLVPAIEGGQWMGQLPPEVPLLPPGDGDDGGGTLPARRGAGLSGLAVAPVIAPPAPPLRPTRPAPPVTTRRAPPPEPVETLPPPPGDEEEGQVEDGDGDDEYRPTRRLGDLAPAGSRRAAPLVGEEPAEGEPDDGGADAPGAPGQGAWALVGSSLLSRSFDLEGVLLADGRAGSVNYHSGYYPGLWLEGAVFPMQLAGERNWLAGLGLQAHLDWGFLKSEVQEQVTQAGATEKVGRMETTTQYQVGGAAVYRFFPFAIGGTPAMFQAKAGLTMTQFALQTGTPGYKSNQTMGFAGGVGFDLPLVTSGDVVFSLDGRGEALIGSTTLNEKTRYPSAPAKGFAVDGGLRLTYASRLLLRATYLYQGIGTDLPQSGDNPKATSNDRYQGFLLLLGYGG